MKNIILITVDCLRYDKVNKRDMPFLYFLKQNGVTYEKAHSNGPSTKIYFVSIFTGKYPSEVSSELIVKNATTFVEKLKKLDTQLQEYTQTHSFLKR